MQMALFRARAFLRKGFSTFASPPTHICVVGSGPAGFYTAEKLLKAHPDAQVDIIDRLPTPFGLVRSGVAPDHPDTKIVVNQFTRVAQHPRCSFFGNIKLGSSISLLDLRELYHAVVLAYGAESDKTLSIPGEDLSGIHSAREFVWWYNGHPDCRNLNPDVKATDTAVILGQGNVALDVARILLRPIPELATTDIASHALEVLQESSIRKVFLVGRRGPVQAACTAKELREVLGIKDLHIRIHESDLLKSPTDEEEVKNSRIQRRVYELLAKAAASGPPHSGTGLRELHFIFFRKPEKFLSLVDKKDHVAGVRFEKTVLEGTSSGKQIARGTGEFEDLDCQMVLKSIGYKSVPIDGLPFDHQKGIVPNVRGRVVSNTYGDAVQLEKGLYVCGWLKRGPTGIIATNLYCAEETVTSICEDLDKRASGSLSSLSKPGREGLLHKLDDRNVRVVPFSAWERIDSTEKRLGNLKNKPREKLTTWEELLKVAME
ncbi:NADPH:adrenodoxin oxidoreductase, mitochondrial [Momordica charantia]|uniref:NADPH:adrenodoxin oxidoreductase, mitochondrial n=1 Tax=Momordica charantia TaxID=3673 RepID=A0A6J1D1A1_MOMCH|nr:NADPH:adrenodoxin oxidoreductase, mitochondrial [Momordica charantia]